MAGRRLTATLGPSTSPSVASRITALPVPCGTLYAIRLVTWAGTVPGARARSTSTATAPDEGMAGTGVWVKRFWVAAASVAPSIRPSSVSGAIEDGHARQGHRIADHIDDEQIVFDVVLAVVAADDLRFVDRADRDRGHLRLVLSGSGNCGRGQRNGRGDDGHKCRHPRAPRDRSQGHGSLLCQWAFVQPRASRPMVFPRRRGSRRDRPSPPRRGSRPPARSPLVHGSDSHALEAFTGMEQSVPSPSASRRGARPATSDGSGEERPGRGPLAPRAGRQPSSAR